MSATSSIQHENDSCPIARTVQLVGDVWTLLIIRDLLSGCKRFGALQQSLQGISPKTLTERLRNLEAAGLVSRRAYAEIPPRVEYSLTEKGRALAPIIEAMAAYGREWLTESG